MTVERAYEKFERLGEKAYSEMYETSFPAGCWSEVKDCFAAAIASAKAEGLTEEVKRLEARLEHIRAVYRSQFS